MSFQVLCSTPSFLLLWLSRWKKKMGKVGKYYLHLLIIFKNYSLLFLLTLAQLFNNVFFFTPSILCHLFFSHQSIIFLVIELVVLCVFIYLFFFFAQIESSFSGVVSFSFNFYTFSSDLNVSKGMLVNYPLCVQLSFPNLFSKSLWLGLNSFSCQLYLFLFHCSLCIPVSLLAAALVSADFFFFFLLASFPLIAVSAPLHGRERGSLTKQLFISDAAASAHFERDRERAEKSKEKAYGLSVLK